VGAGVGVGMGWLVGAGIFDEGAAGAAPTRDVEPAGMLRR
jgi:hypothetical protein